MWGHEKKPLPKYDNPTQQNRPQWGSGAFSMSDMASLMGNQAMLAYLDRQSEQSKPAATGKPLSDALREKFECKSGVPLDDVRVHYNSDKPKQLGAEAYAQGNEIHIGPGNEQDLGHEVGHVVQQKQGVVKPTERINGLSINRDEHLERVSIKHTSTLHNCKRPYAPIIQCCSYDKNCPNADPCPIHSKTYSQERDQTLRPFLRNKKYIAQDAMVLQAQGKSVTAEQIRVLAHAGAGLHEILPTDMRNTLPHVEGISGLQSGARTDAGNTVFFIDGEIAGHTGTFSNLSGRNTLLRGQSKAHDVVRKPVREIGGKKARYAGVKAHKIRVSILVHGIKSLATGREIIKSKLLNAVMHKRTKRSLDSSSPTGTQNRIAFAQQKLESREHAKRRLCQIADREKIPRPVSPERGPIDEFGNGGEPIISGVPLRPASPLPAFDGSTADEKAANEAAYVTAPLRRWFSSPNMKQCSCGEYNEPNVTWCQYCGKRL